MKHLLVLTLVFLTACSSSPTRLQTPKEMEENRNSIDAAIHARRDEYRACYEKELNQNKKLGAGKILMSWEIQADGTAKKVKVFETTLVNHRVESCVAGILATTRFPAQVDVATIKYPFSFGTDITKTPEITVRYSDRECQHILDTDRKLIASKNNINEVVRTFLFPPKIKDGSLYSTPDPKLRDLYLGYRFENASALVLQFKAGAEAFLNGNTCQQTVNREPLKKMLLEIKGIGTVQFEINGQIQEQNQ